MPVFMANHRIRFFWLFHRARHADTDMDTTTALRFHPGELVLSTFIRMPVIIFIGMSFAEIVVFETMLNISTLFHHCNLATPEKWDRVLRAVIVTPNVHRVHHSMEMFETNSNYTSLLSVWDRLFRSFRKREDTLTITIGLPRFREKNGSGSAVSSLPRSFVTALAEIHCLLCLLLRTLELISIEDLRLVNIKHAG